MMLRDGRSVVPDNRFDLAPEPAGLPTVSVVIPYYDQPRQLDLVLAALTLQDYPPEKIDVVVADDGSAVPPALGPWTPRLDVSSVRQEDEGFRAAAARNLGAAASVGTILCFLDADTVPAPDYLRRAVRLPSVLPDALVVGRRKHTDLSEFTPTSLRRWMADAVLRQDSNENEPSWLVDGYRRTENLLFPGWDGYKYIISAVLTCSRELFDDVGGFDSSFTSYGGEDWEFANRAFMMGAVFAHEPNAVAWHDGPDWGERDVARRTEQKNGEALALAPLITDPAARMAGLRYRVPDVAVTVSVDGHSPASLTSTVASILRQGDCAVWLVGEDAEAVHGRLGVWDSRIRIGRPDESILGRARFSIDVVGRVRFADESLNKMKDLLGPGRAGGVVVELEVSSGASVTVWTSRAIHRARRWVSYSDFDDTDLRTALFGVRRVGTVDLGLTVVADEPWLSW